MQKWLEGHTLRRVSNSPYARVIKRCLATAIGPCLSSGSFPFGLNLLQKAWFGRLVLVDLLRRAKHVEGWDVHKIKRWDVAYCGERSIKRKQKMRCLSSGYYHNPRIDQYWLRAIVVFQICLPRREHEAVLSIDQSQWVRCQLIWLIAVGMKRALTVKRYVQ